MISFFREVGEEAKKLHLPTKKETYITTVTVIITVLITSLAILLADFVISKFIGIIFGL